MTKKVLLSICTVAAIAVLGLTSCDKNIAPAQFPANIQTYVQQKYPGAQILIAKEDNELFSKKYEITLNNGIELKFDSDGNLIDLDMGD